MPVTRDEYRLAILDDGMEGWAPLAYPFGYAAQYFPALSDDDRRAMVADLLRDLLRHSLIAVARQPDAGRRPRPLSPPEALVALAAAQSDPASDLTMGYMTTRPGAAEYQAADVCSPCEGYVSRLAVDRVDFEHGLVGGVVPVCDDHRRVRDWPEGAVESIAQSIGDAVDDLRARPVDRLN